MNLLKITKNNFLNIVILLSIKANLVLNGKKKRMEITALSSYA